LEKAHTRGIRVIFDFVPNHTGVGFWAFQDVVKRGPGSPYWDWYFIRRWPFTPGDGTAYEGWWGLGSLPKLNTANPEVFEYLLQVALYRLDFGFDGMRIDVPNELLNAEEFFSRLRAAVKAKNPEFYIVGEIWHIAPEWVQGRMFDSLMNYALGRGILLRYAKGEISGEEALARLSRYYAAYGENVTAMGFNLVSSHDTSRMLSDLGGGDIGDTPPPEVLTRFKLLLTLLFTQPGMPVIFQGEERGLLGRKENFDAQRYPIPWEALNLEVFRHIQKLVRWREELPELTESKIRMFSGKRAGFGLLPRRGRWSACPREQLLPAGALRASPGEVASTGIGSDFAKEHRGSPALCLGSRPGERTLSGKKGGQGKKRAGLKQEGFGVRNRGGKGGLNEAHFFGGCVDFGGF